MTGHFTHYCHKSHWSNFFAHPPLWEMARKAVRPILFPFSFPIVNLRTGIGEE